MKFELKNIKEQIRKFKGKPTGIPFLDKRFNAMKNPEGYTALYYRFFFALVQTYKPRTIVELGAWQGTSAAHFAAANNETLVITVDHHTDPGDQENRLMTIEATENFGNLKYHQGWTCDRIYNEQKDLHSLGKGQNAFPKVVKELDGRKIDILFIDSWHEYKQAKKDWYAYTPLLSDNALIICDDILQGTVGSGIDNMRKFWDEIKAEKFLDTKLHKGYPIGFVKWIRKD